MDNDSHALNNFLFLFDFFDAAVNFNFSHYNNKKYYYHALSISIHIPSMPLPATIVSLVPPVGSLIYTFKN